MTDQIPDENEEVIKQLMGDLQASRGREAQLAGNLSSIGAANKEGNLITFQIETAELLEKLEHFYRGEYVGVIDETSGDMGWVKPTDPEQVPLNDYGVGAMMEIVSKYVDKNTILSYYSEMRIFEILADLGDELVMFVLSNYEKMGMNTNFKKTKFRLLIVTTLHMVESTYRKAIGGKSLEEINQSRIVTQSDSLGKSYPMVSGRKKFSLFNPRTWNG